MMKPLLIRLLPLLCALCLCACVAPEAAVTPAPAASALAPSATPVALTEDDLVAMLCEREGVDASCVLGCVLALDGAYERVGVVLYEDRAEGMVYAAFMDADGFCQRCGLSGKPAANPELKYLGGGTVSFRLVFDGVENLCKLSFSAEDGNVLFASSTSKIY